MFDRFAFASLWISEKKGQEGSWSKSSKAEGRFQVMVNSQKKQESESKITSRKAKLLQRPETNQFQ